MLGQNPFLKYFSKEGFKKYIEEVDKELEQDVSLFQEFQLLKGTEGIVFQVGDDPASNVYVRNKISLCKKFHLNLQHVKFSENSKSYFYECIQHAIDLRIPSIVQFPVPWEDVIVGSLKLGDLDIDGLSEGSIVDPCTPSGILKHLQYVYARENVNIEGKTILIIGRSALVGKPLARLAVEAGMNVIQIHSKTNRLDRERFYSMADVIVCAVGKPDFITLADAQDFMRPDVMVYDVGINRTEDGKLVGDCDTRLFEHGYAVSPVPGGVGLLTTRMFVQNLLTISNIVNTN